MRTAFSLLKKKKRFGMEFLIFKNFGIGKRLIHPKPNQLPLLCAYEVKLVEPYIFVFFPTPTLLQWMIGVQCFGILQSS